jgi:hypothetical protein
LSYATALSFLEEKRGGSLPAGAFAANGGILKMRIARLLGLNEAPTFPRTTAVILLAIASIGAGLIALIAHGAARAQSVASQGDSSSNEAVTNEVTGRVQVRKLTIVSGDLSRAEQLQIIQAYQGNTYPLRELMQRIRQGLRDRGYVNATVEILQPASVPSGPPPQPMDVSVQVSAGAQYTLSGFSIVGAQALSQDEIIRQFPLHPGDLFNATAIGKGLDNLKKLYGSRGYVNFGARPRLQMDDVRHAVTLILAINEGRPGAA